jgi:hypothetical protein
LRFDFPILRIDGERSSCVPGLFWQIVKERQMVFDTETDPETLYELFGEDAASLAE